MASLETIERTKLLGHYMMFLGVGAMAVMSIAGYVALFAIIIFASSSTHGHSGGGGDSFMSGFMFGWIFSGHECYHHHSDLASLIVMSLIVSAIAIALAVAYGFSTIGIGLAIGWGVSLALTALGAIVYELGESLQGAPVTAC